jgi:hypothetical protein
MPIEALKDRQPAAARVKIRTLSEELEVADANMSLNRTKYVNLRIHWQKKNGW